MDALWKTAQQWTNSGLTGGETLAGVHLVIYIELWRVGFIILLKQVWALKACKLPLLLPTGEKNNIQLECHRHLKSKTFVRLVVLTNRTQLSKLFRKQTTTTKRGVWVGAQKKVAPHAPLLWVSANIACFPSTAIHVPARDAPRNEYASRRSSPS